MFQVKLRRTVGNTGKYVQRTAEACGKANRGELLSVFINKTLLLGRTQADKQNLCAALVDCVDDIVSFFFAEEAVTTVDFDGGIFFS